MRRIVATFAFLVCLSFSGLGASWPRVLESVRPLQALNPETETLSNICTTTSISQKHGYWVTAAHCVEQPTFIGGEPTSVVFADHRIDVAVLQTPTLHVKSLRLQKTTPHVGQQVFMVGHPLGLADFQLFQGYISSIHTELEDGTYTLFQMEACGGNSGSSVVNDKDEIVSILQIGFGRPCSSFTGGALWRELARAISKYVD